MKLIVLSSVGYYEFMFHYKITKTIKLRLIDSTQTKLCFLFLKMYWS